MSLANIIHSISILIVMIVTFLTMYNKNQFFYNAHGIYKNVLLVKKTNTRKPYLRTIKV